MNRTVLAYLIGLVALLLVGVIAVGILGGRLDQALVAEARAEIRGLDEARRTIDQARDALAEWSREEPQLFTSQGLDAKWNSQLDNAAKQLAQAGSQVEQLETLLEANDKDQTPQVRSAIASIRGVRLGVMQGVATVREAAQQLIEFKREADEKIPAMQQDVEAIAKVDLTGLESQVAEAVVNWPEKKDDLQLRLTSLKSLQENAPTIWESTAAARQRIANDELSGEDVTALIQAANRLQQSYETLVSAPAILGDLIEQLNWSWDKMLVDMAILEGSQVAFEQTFQTTKTYGLAGENETAETKELPEQTVTVPKQTYESMKSYLGMVVEHKPAGKYDSESTKVVEPPGYAYVAPQSQGSNRYGYWDRRPGHSVWIWYGGYSHFGRTMGYPSYGPLTSTMYDDYSQRRRSGAPYYGTTQAGSKLYGSDGAVTKTKYASSRYVRTGGFRNTQYVKSGGTYRGSAYAARNTASRTSSSRSYSSRSSGFRSSGGFGGK